MFSEKATSWPHANDFGWLYISPLLLVLIPFFVAPILVVLAASLFQSDGFGGLIPAPTLRNYADVLRQALTFNLYYETIKFTVLTWFFSLIIGFLGRVFPSLPRAQPAARRSACSCSAPCRSGPRTSSA